MMKNKQILMGILGFLLVFGFTLVGCDQPTDPTNSPEVETLPPTETPNQTFAPTIRSVPQPVFQHSIVNNVSIPAQIVPTDYYTDGVSNFFLINSGIINHAHISTILQEHYIGIETILQQRTVNETSITQAASQTIHNSVTVTRFDSTTHTANVSTSITAAAQAGPSFARASVSATISASWSGQWATSHTNAETNARSLTTSVSEFERIAVENTTTITIRNMPHGFYRRAIYSTVRVWVIVETTLDNSEVLSITTVSVPQGEPLIRWSFCADGIFDNSPINGSIDFHYGFQRNFPIPQLPQQPPPIPPILRRIEQSFGANTSWSLPSNVRFPATIEIYALGAGGGGQGGHRDSAAGHNTGTGGAGGGGAAAYVRFEITETANFSITVGRGGEGGASRQQSNSYGDDGVAGGNTIVSWGANNITAGGGRGGGRENPGTDNRAGGIGGVPNITGPHGFLGILSAHGSPGTAGGGPNTNAPSTGGNAGRLSIGSVSPFPATNDGIGAFRPQNERMTHNDARHATRGGGGAGEFNHRSGGDERRGSPGGDGQVIIVVFWYD